jgi:PilZ domain
MMATGSARERMWPEDRTMDSPTQERRNEARHRALKRDRITFKGRRATIDCTVLNLSDLGACLKVESPIGIPDTFDLVLDNAPVRSCRVAWRSATQIGVEFT